MSSKRSKVGRRIRSNHSGNTELFKFYAREANRRFRRKARLTISVVLSGDVNADERLERHIRHTAGWDAY